MYKKPGQRTQMILFGERTGAVLMCSSDHFRTWAALAPEDPYKKGADSYQTHEKLSDDHSLLCAHAETLLLSPVFHGANVRDIEGCKKLVREIVRCKPEPAAMELLKKVEPIQCLCMFVLQSCLRSLRYYCCTPCFQSVFAIVSQSLLGSCCNCFFFMF